MLYPLSYEGGRPAGYRPPVVVGTAPSSPRQRRAVGAVTTWVRRQHG